MFTILNQDKTLAITREDNNYDIYVRGGVKPTVVFADNNTNKEYSLGEYTDIHNATLAMGVLIKNILKQTKSESISVASNDIVNGVVSDASQQK